FPRLRVLLASERSPGAPAGQEETTAMARLRVAITLNGLDDVIHLLGPRDDLATLVGISDLAVFPQWATPLSRGVSLALAHGLPVIATEGGNLPEQVADAWGCLTVAPGDPAGLAQAMAEAIEELAALTRDARHNRALSHDWLRAEVEVARLQTLYRAICLPDGPASTLHMPAAREVGSPATDDSRQTAPFPLVSRSRAWANTLWALARESQESQEQHNELVPLRSRSDQRASAV
ncbi:MAG TPA: glycosyltransferase, partial [Ktedonobacterales bacterium]|nr:glycosyltransferase [Ktedonobacterales bacterium]